MKRLLAFIQKEVWHILRDFRTLVVVFGLPVIQVLIFGFAIRNEVENVPVVFCDKSGDAVTQAVISKVLAGGNFVYAGNISREEAAVEVFRRGEAKAAVVFGSDFGKRYHGGESPQVQFLIDASDPNTATTIRNYLTGILKGFLKQKQEEKGLQNPMLMVPEVRMLYNESLSSAKLFVPGILVVILLVVSAMITSLSLTREKEIGTMEVLLASPLRPWTIILGKLAPYLLISFFNACVILALGFVVFNVPVKGSLGLLFAESLLFVLVALALGVFLSTTSRSQQEALMKSLFALLMPSILLSGFLFPIANMPLPLQALSTLMPARWFIVILRAIMLQGTGIEAFWQETLILAAMAVLLVAASIKKFKIRLEE
ncbi:MAG: ABC transporter permease [Cytophagales bacterium]|nr:ABC transporter permease [Cytophagales bacterium]